MNQQIQIVVLLDKNDGPSHPHLVGCNLVLHFVSRHGVEALCYYILFCQVNA